MTEMSKLDTIQMMQRCADEIQTLRQRLAIVEPKAHAYDALCTVLDLLPKPSQGYGEDLVWRLRKQVEELLAPDPEPVEVAA